MKAPRKLENESSATGNSRPPVVDDLLGQIFYRAHEEGALPDIVPSNVPAAIRWWLSVMEPKINGEGMYRVIGPTGKQRWVCGYHDRVTSSLKKFLDLKREDQDYVLAAREEGIFYRGDEMDFFVKVVAESQRMAEIGVAAYRAESKAKIVAALSRMGGANKKRHEAMQGGRGDDIASEVIHG